jgi:hypothetical protein
VTSSISGPVFWTTDQWNYLAMYVCTLSSFPENLSYAVSQEILHVFWSPKVHYNIHRSLPLNIILSQMNQHPQTLFLYHFKGCATLSCQPPTVVTQVQSQVRSWGICGEQSGTGADFLWVLQSSLPIFIPPTAPYSLMNLSMLYSLNTHTTIK